MQMTLKNIIISALVHYYCGRKIETIEVYRDELMKYAKYANDAQDDIALLLKLMRTEKKMADGGVVNLNTLARRCIRVESIRQHEHKVPFRQSDLTNDLLLPYETEAEITYRFLPNRLEHLDDISELPEYTYPLLISYIIGRKFMENGDSESTRLASIYFSMYNAAKEKLKRSY